MNLKGPLGLILIALGAAALAWPEFSYTKEREAAKLGPLEFALKTQETVHIPAWAGLAVLAAGTVLVWRRKA